MESNWESGFWYIITWLMALTFDMESLSAKDLIIFREKARAFCELVKISFNKLQYKELPLNPQQLNKENVIKLVRIFHNESCLRQESNN